MSGQYGSPDTDSTNDQNASLTLELAPTDKLEISTRINKRNSYRVIGNGVLIDQGWGADRGTRRTDIYAYGMRALIVNSSVANQVPSTSQPWLTALPVLVGSVKKVA